VANEILSVPEEKVGEVIRVIRAGLDTKPSRISKETIHRLHQWCKDEEKYLRRTMTEEFWP
jgi:hypothetical protein